jgi:hypothetical protein
MIGANPRRTVTWLTLAVLGGGLIAIGILEIFALYGLVPLLIGIGVVTVSVRYSTTIRRIWPVVAALVAAAVTAIVLLWGSEHVWANPSCSQQSNQISGRITYWSGASVSWICVNGGPVVTHDSR